MLHWCAKILFLTFVISCIWGGSVVAQQSALLTEAHEGADAQNTLSLTGHVESIQHSSFHIQVSDIYFFVPREVLLVGSDNQALSWFSLREGDQVRVLYDVRGQPKTALRIQRLP